MMRLGFLISHPIQYYAPIFRELAKVCDLTVYFAHRQTGEGQASAGFGVAPRPGSQRPSAGPGALPGQGGAPVGLPGAGQPVTTPDPPLVVPAPVVTLRQAADLPDPGPVRTRWVLLALGGALLLGGLLRRLPDEVLRVAPAAQCEET